MRIIDNYNLINNNTFGLSVLAQKYIEYDKDSDIIELLKSQPDILDSKVLVIGEGSNILFVEDFSGVIIHPATKDVDIVNSDDDYIYVKVSAGVVWDKFVEWSLQNNFYGLENLSLIPGTVGASAVQNIGAYGVEAADFIYSVKYLNLENLDIVEIKAEECNFDYRNSIFKNILYAKTIILSVIYRLYKKEKLNTDYADIKAYFNTDKDITSFKIREAVINIRNRKLPNPSIIGNAGSFFKNPIIDKIKLEELLASFPDIKYYKISEDSFKLAAGWLIDKCELKSFSHNQAAVHSNQALVLINKGDADGKDIVELSEIVKTKVLDKFGVFIEPEVIFV